MQMPGVPSITVLVVILLVMPWLAFRGAQRRAAALRDPKFRLPPRPVIWISTIVSQLILLTLTWVTGNGFGYAPFDGVGTITLRDVIAAMVALGSFFLMRGIARRFRADDERKKMLVYQIVPRCSVEWILWIAAVIVASISEEVVYRGVTMQILWYSLGNPWAAALICAVAFAAAHWAQGFKSAMFIFAFALVTHLLVWVTGTLILAMIIHAIYDLAAGYLISREAKRLGIPSDDSPQEQPA